MKVSDIVVNKINRLKTGYVFTYDDFDVPMKNLSVLKMALNRLANAGRSGLKMVVINLPDNPS
jgi:hypothetical protein